MEEALQPARTIALFPFAVRGKRVNMRQADLCRGIACFLERRLGTVPGVETMLQHIFVAPESDPDRRGWLMTNQLWTVEQAQALPLPTPRPNFLIQGRARWEEDEFEIEMELIDLDAGISRFRGGTKGNPAEKFIDFFKLFRALASEALPRPNAATVACRPPTKSPVAFEHYLRALAALQARAVGLGNHEPVLFYLTEAIQADAEFREACEQLERIVTECLEAGGTALDHALEALETAHAAAPAFFRFDAMLGLTLAGRGDVQRARTHLESYLRHEKRGLLASGVLRQLARMHREDNDIEKALRLLRRATEACPENAEAWEELGDLSADGGNSAEAEEYWRRALQEDDERPGALLSLAGAYYERCDWHRALFLLNRKQALPTGGREHLPMLVRCLIEISRLGEADDIATAWAEEHTQDWLAWLRLAEVRRLMNQPDAARWCLGKAQELVSSPAEHAEIALQFFALDAPADYAKFRRVMALGPTSKLNEDEQARYARAAAQILKELTDRNAGVPALWVWLAKMSERAGNFADAADAQRRVVELMPGVAGEEYRLGQLLARADHLPESADAFRRACDLTPDSSEYHADLGEVLLKASELDEAEVALRRSLELVPTNESARERLRELRRQRETQRVIEVPIVPEELPSGGLMQWILDRLGRR